MTTNGAVQERDPETAAPAAADTPQPAAGEQGLQRSAAASIGFGMSASNWEEGFRIANQLAKSNLVPKAYQEKAQDIVVAMQLGAELGLPPMQSLQSIAVINGRPGVYGDGFLAVIMSSPAYHRHSEYYVVNGERREFLTSEDLKLPDTAAVSSFWRKNNPDPFTATFSIADAQRAQLLSKQGPWTQYPARMMKFRARGFAGRDAFAGELRGMRTAEELHDIPEVTVESIAPPPAEPVRRSEKASAAPATEESAPATQAQPEVAESGAQTQKPAGAGKTAAAAKTAPDEFTQVGPGQVLKNVRITNTSVIDRTKTGGGLLYEIQGDTGPDGKPGATQTWLTKDEQLYRAAASCEGSASRFTVTCHTAKAADAKKDVKVITGLQGD